MLIPRKTLGDTLRELDFDGLSRTDVAPPPNPIDKSAALVASRGNQFTSELIKGFVYRPGSDTTNC